MNTIYCYYRKSDNKPYYVGRTNNLKRRHYQHKNDRYPLPFDKYASEVGWDKFDLRVLEEVPEDQKKIRERYWYFELKPIMNKKNPHMIQEDWDRLHRWLQERKEQYECLAAMKI